MTRGQIWIIAAAGLVFALVFGVRQSVALFIGDINSATGLGIAAISLAFACAQLMWGITQPVAGAIADKYGTGRVIAAGAVLVMLGTVLTPHATSTWMLILLIGVVSAGGAGMAGMGVLMSAVARALPAEAARPCDRHGQRRRLVRAIPDRAARCAAHRRHRLGRRADRAGVRFARDHSARVGAARQASACAAGRGRPRSR
jgi:MFS family permease